MKKNTTAERTSGDIRDSKKDQEQLKSEKATLDLPDAEEIPGQENVHPPKMNEMADTTIASADEEGEGLLDQDEDDALNDDTNVTPDEKRLLRRAASSSANEEEERLRSSVLDNRDEDGEPLNEQTELSGKDLDVPGSEDDDDNEELGEEDEENNNYSLGADKD